MFARPTHQGTALSGIALLGLGLPGGPFHQDTNGSSCHMSKDLGSTLEKGVSTGLWGVGREVSGSSAHVQHLGAHGNARAEGSCVSLRKASRPLAFQGKEAHRTHLAVFRVPSFTTGADPSVSKLGSHA